MRVPKEVDPHRDLYDYDLSSHIMTMLDWGVETGNQKFVAHHHSNGDNKPTSILVNGLGKFETFNFTNQTEELPIARFTVEQVGIRNILPCIKKYVTNIIIFSAFI